MSELTYYIAVFGLGSPVPVLLSMGKEKFHSLFFLGGGGGVEGQGGGRCVKKPTKKISLEENTVVVLHSLFKIKFQAELKKVLRKDRYITLAVGTFNFHKIFLEVNRIWETMVLIQNQGIGL